MKCTFVVGQKVVCIHGGPWYEFGTGSPSEPPHPQLNGVYTISGLRPVAFCGLVGLALKELAGSENYYLHGAFRPLHDRPKEAETDISIFYPLLDLTRKREPVA